MNKQTINIKQRYKITRSSTTNTNQHTRNERRDVQLVNQIVNGEGKEVEGRRTSTEHTGPPPFVIFTRQLEVADDNRDLSRGNEGNDNNSKEEAKDHIRLMKEHTGHHQIKL